MEKLGSVVGQRIVYLRVTGWKREEGSVYRSEGGVRSRLEDEEGGEEGDNGMQEDQ